MCVFSCLFYVLLLADPILIDTKMDTVDAKWNDTGSILAIAGTQRASAQLDRDVNVVQFFSPFGEVMK